MEKTIIGYEPIEGEEWNFIDGFDDYMVSNKGRILSFKCPIPRILSPSTHSQGYKRVNLFRDYKWHHKRIHRLVAEAFIPNPLNKPQVDHINRITNDNRVENLRWVTVEEQMTNRGGKFGRYKDKQRPNRG